MKREKESRKGYIWKACGILLPCPPEHEVSFTNNLALMKARSKAVPFRGKKVSTAKMVQRKLETFGSGKCNTGNATPKCDRDAATLATSILTLNNTNGTIVKEPVPQPMPGLVSGRT